MDPLSAAYFHFRTVSFETYKFTQVPLQPSCADSWLKQQTFNSRSSWPMVTCTEQENSFTARNGDPTWPEGCFLSPFVQRRREVAHPVLIKDFLQLSPEAAMCLWFCVEGAYQILVNPTSGDSRSLGGISTNLFLSLSIVTLPSWWHGFLFMTCRTCILTTLLSGWRFLFLRYMQIVEPLQSLQAWPTWLSWSSLMNTWPPSPLRWW